MTSIPFKINWLATTGKISFLLLSFGLIVYPADRLMANENMDTTTAEMSNPHGMPVQVDENARFAPCPKRPNCVSSMFFQDKGHYVLPISIMPLGEKSRIDRLLEVINSFENIKVVEMDDNYLRVEFTSKWFGFVDDVEFLIKDSHTDVRSASRIGYSDMGVNRRRIEDIRERLQAQESK